MPKGVVSNKTNLDLFQRNDVVNAYADAVYLTESERSIFDGDIGIGKAILDLGVGGGRTAKYLAPVSREYVGSDYSPAMVEAGRRNYPHLRFEVVDAVDLSRFANESFDVVLFSFNGLGNIGTHQERITCHREVHRVLKPGGLWIFSLHHAGSLFLRPQFPWRSAIGTLFRSVPRFLERIRFRAFWNGLDYHHIAAHGGMRNLLARRSRVKEEVDKVGFRMDRILGDDYPRPNIPVMTRWYYYVCRKC